MDLVPHRFPNPPVTVLIDLMTPRLGGSFTLVSLHFFTYVTTAMFFCLFCLLFLRRKTARGQECILYSFHIFSRPRREFCSSKVPDKQGDLSILTNQSAHQGCVRIPWESDLHSLLGFSVFIEREGRAGCRSVPVT